MKQWSQITSYKNEAEQQAAGILIKLIVATGIAYLVNLLIGIYYYDVKLIVTLSVGITLLIVPYILLRRGQLSAASIFFMLLVLGTLTVSAIVGDGINDVIIVAFPIIYFFASMVLNRAAFRILFALTLFTTFWLTFGELKGWFVPQPFEQTGWVDFVMVAVILSIAAFASDLLATSWRKNLERAEQEITERKQAEEALRESEEKYRLIVENANDGIEITQNDMIIHTNFRLAEMLGYTVDELKNVSFLKIFSEQGLKDLYKRQEKRKSSELVSTYYETTLRKKDGTLIDVDIKYNIIDFRGEPATFAIIRDITERRQAEEALAESDSLRELLLDIITHDLRNPAGNIYALSEAARQDMPENKFLEAIYTSSGRLMEVLTQTTTLSQAAFGDTIPKEALSLNTLLQETADEFASSLSMAEMELVVAIAPNLIIEANPLIGEVFKNYISNAIKYARDGKRIVIETVIEDQTVIVCVKDSGKTIAETDRDRIFERRIQLENGEERGRGLGLAIVKRIALAHDGEVWVEPNTPVGNSFCLRIPHHENDLS